MRLISLLVCLSHAVQLGFMVQESRLFTYAVGILVCLQGCNFRPESRSTGAGSLSYSGVPKSKAKDIFVEHVLLDFGKDLQKMSDAYRSNLTQLLSDKFVHLTARVDQEGEPQSLDELFLIDDVLHRMRFVIRPSNMSGDFINLEAGPQNKWDMELYFTAAEIDCSCNPFLVYLSKWFCNCDKRKLMEDLKNGSIDLHKV